MNKKADRGRATREQLIEIATGLFAEHGYEATSIEAVLQAAQVSRGALYHHFAGKDALFKAVLESVETDVDGRLADALAGIEDPVEVLRAACVLWVTVAGDPVVQQIVLIDGPAVLGWRRWRELEEQYGLGMAKSVMRRIAKDGRLPMKYADPFAHMLLASLNEIGIMIARSDDEKKAMREGRAALEEMINRLLPEG